MQTENPNLETFKKRLEWFRMLRELESDDYRELPDDYLTVNYYPLEN